MRSSILTALLLAPLMTGPAAAQVPSKPAAAAPGPSAADAQRQADIGRIQDYLDSLSTAQADFTFVAPDGSVSRGVFDLDRPSRLRFEYTEPKGNLLIADGDYVIYWDAAQKEASNLPIGQTPLAFLLRPKVSLTDGVRITAYEHAAGVVRLTLVQTKDPEDGSVTVAFTDQPLALRGWRLVDAQGQITDVSFSNWRFGMALAASLFHFEGPHPGKQGR